MSYNVLLKFNKLSYVMLEDEAGYVLLKQQNLKSVDPANF